MDILLKWKLYSYWFSITKLAKKKKRDWIWKEILIDGISFAIARTTKYYWYLSFIPLVCTMGLGPAGTICNLCENGSPCSFFKEPNVALNCKFENVAMNEEIQYGLRYFFVSMENILHTCWKDKTEAGNLGMTRSVELKYVCPVLISVYCPV